VKANIKCDVKNHACYHSDPSDPRYADPPSPLRNWQLVLK